MAISLRQIRYFVSTAELGQITKASLALNISQSAITMAIKDLEAEIGTALLDRLPQGVGLTPAGRQFLSHAYGILAKVDEATSVNMPVNGVTGSISVATTYTVMGYFLPNHIEKLKRSFPKLDIKLSELNREAIEEGLLSNRFDIAVLLTSNVQNPDIRKETLLGSRRRLWVAAGHRLLHLDSVGLKEVAEEPYVMLTVDEAAVTAGRYWGETTFQPSIVLRTFSVEAVRSMAANGQGVAILSDMVRRPWSLESKRIETIDLRESIPPMDIGLAWRRTLEFTPALRAFREYFRQASSWPYVR